MSDLVGSLKENIVATAFEDRRITDSALAERLIRERFDAAAEIERLRAALKPFADAAAKAAISGSPVFYFVGADDYERAAFCLSQQQRAET